MKRITIAIVSCLLFLFTSAQNNAVSIIPQPVSLQMGTGAFVINKASAIEINTASDDVKRVAGFLSKKISNAIGFVVPVKQTSSSAKGNIHLSLVNDAGINKEGYKLMVTPTNVSISANSGAGLFYGMQTLIQLLPKEINSKSVVKNINWLIPSVTITDYPRFGWRGLMFDVTRHFFTKEEVKHFIDDMVQYKYNLLHLHLSDDQGWRLEIKSLPDLTKIGAWRPKREGKWANTKAPEPNEPKDYGGFYTYEDIKELVQYARD